MEQSGQEPFPLEKSAYYSFWLKEKHEIEKLKWILSEKAGGDVGWDYSLWRWTMGGHRQKWLDQLKASGDSSQQT